MSLNDTITSLGTSIINLVNKKVAKSRGAYLYETELLRDSEGITYMDKMVHSTFDPTKFIFHQNETNALDISLSGDISGFTTNYVELPSLNITKSLAWEVQFLYTTPSIFTQNQTLIDKKSTENDSYIKVWIDTNKQIQFLIAAEGSTVLPNSYATYPNKVKIEINTSYLFKIGYVHGRYYFKVRPFLSNDENDEFLLESNPSHLITKQFFKGEDNVEHEYATKDDVIGFYNDLEEFIPLTFLLDNKYEDANGNFYYLTTRLLQFKILNCILGVQTVNDVTKVNPCLGSFDLKYFKLTSLGRTIFSGCVSGKDFFVPDNYTTVGNVNIAQDGIATEFSTDNYIIKNNAITISETGEFRIDFSFNNIYDGSVGSEQYIFDIYDNISNQTTNSIIFRASGHAYQVLVFNVDATDTYHRAYQGSCKFLNETSEHPADNANHDHISGYFEYKNGVYNLHIEEILKGDLFDTYRKEVQYVELNNDNTHLKMKPGVYNLSIGRRLSQSEDLTGHPLKDGGYINLNAFKINIDNKIAYRPCFSIPYILTKSGSKVVEGSYRQNTLNYYNEYGVSPYYTFDTINKNWYSIPIGDMYGLNNDMPADIYDDLAFGESGAIYTAPTRGWFFISKNAGAVNKFVTLKNLNNSMTATQEATTESTNLTLYIPVKQGDRVKLDYNAEGETNYFRFVYTEGYRGGQK